LGRIDAENEDNDIIRMLKSFWWMVTPWGIQIVKKDVIEQ
jgi:hypothetical protein